LTSIGVSLLLVIWRASRPRYRTLGRHPGSTNYGDIARWSNTIETPGIVIARFDDSLFFANLSYLYSTTYQKINSSKYPVYYFILDCSSINQVDSTVIDSIGKLYQSLEDLGTIMLFASVKKGVTEVFLRGKLHKIIPEKNSSFFGVHEAVLFAEDSLRLKLKSIRSSKSIPTTPSTTTNVVGTTIELEEIKRETTIEERRPDINILTPNVSNINLQPTNSNINLLPGDLTTSSQYNLNPNQDQFNEQTDQQKNLNDLI